MDLYSIIILFFFVFQNLPALVLKIMSGSFAPISDRYSPELRQLVLTMLNLDPSKRPQLNEIMALPICIRPLLNLYTDIGSVKMRRCGLNARRMIDTRFSALFFDS